jgi:hypothetical protein
MNAKDANLENCHSERSEESALVFDPEAAAEQIPHRFRFGKPQRKGFGMTRFFLLELSLLEENKRAKQKAGSSLRSE